VKVALVVPPVAPTFSSIVRPDVRARMKAVLARLAAAHGDVYRDYFDDGRFETADFANATHVNSTNGTEKFSRILDAEIVRPALVPDAPSADSVGSARP
jgi:hypothetical protein